MIVTGLVNDPVIIDGEKLVEINLSTRQYVEIRTAEYITGGADCSDIIIDGVNGPGISLSLCTYLCVIRNVCCQTLNLKGRIKEVVLDNINCTNINVSGSLGIVSVAHSAVKATAKILAHRVETDFCTFNKGLVCRPGSHSRKNTTIHW